MKPEDKDKFREKLKTNGGRYIAPDSKTGHTIKENHRTSIAGTIRALRKK